MVGIGAVDQTGGWNSLNISDSSTIKARIGWQGLTTSEYQDKGGHLLITGTEFENGKINWNKCHFVSQWRFDQDLNIQVRDGDILITKDGTIGKVAIVENLPLPATLNSGVFVIRPKDNAYNPKFVFQIFRSRIFKNFLDQLAAGSTINHLYQKDIIHFNFSVPKSQLEQKAIAKVLSNADALIQSLEKIIEKKKRIKEGMMQELLRPKEGWVETSLWELSGQKRELFNDGDWIEAEHITNAGVRLMQTGNIGVGRLLEEKGSKYIYSDSFDKLKCKPLKNNDILICRLAEPAGRACLFSTNLTETTITSVDVTIFRPPIGVNRQFLVLLMSTKEWFDKIKKSVGGTTHKRISRSALGKIRFKIPSAEHEQRTIAQILGDIDSELDVLEKKAAKLSKMKIGIMQQLLTGKIRLV